MSSPTPKRSRVDDNEDSLLLRSRTNAKPNAAVWLSVSMIVAGTLVLAVGAAPSVLKTGVALLNGATYHPESAAAEAAVLDAEVMQPDGGGRFRDNDPPKMVLDAVDGGAAETVVDRVVANEEEEEREKAEREKAERENAERKRQEMRVRKLRR
jgi:hypothetical protein